MIKRMVMVVATVLLCSGCATLKNNFSMGADRTSLAFFEDLQRSDTSAAYGLFAKGLSQRVSYDQFDEFMQTIREQWGRIESEDTVFYPFHQRAGEANFIPLHISPDKVKRYTYDVKFENADMNFDLTLALEGHSYKIIWFSIWGSSIYVNPKIQEKINTLFSNQGNAGEGS